MTSNVIPNLYLYLSLYTICMNLVLCFAVCTFFFFSLLAAALFLFYYDYALFFKCVLLSPHFLMYGFLLLLLVFYCPQCVFSLLFAGLPVLFFHSSSSYISFGFVLFRSFYTMANTEKRTLLFLFLS